MGPLQVIVKVYEVALFVRHDEVVRISRQLSGLSFQLLASGYQREAAANFSLYGQKEAARSIRLLAVNFELWTMNYEL